MLKIDRLSNTRTQPPHKTSTYSIYPQIVKRQIKHVVSPERSLMLVEDQASRSKESFNRP